MGKGKVTTKETDKGFKSLMLEFKKLEAKPFVKVGLPEGKPKTKAERDGVTNLDIAVVNEFGAGPAPERSHIRAAFDQNKKELNQFTEKLMIKILDGKMKVDAALELLGLKKVSNIQKLVRSGLTPPLKRREGTPLIDTGVYISSITFAKIMKGKK